ncbi:hypothetical protein C5167_030163 [Papaver somniferum]|uniref:la-related protein 6B-like n=1 Tax=Papaver somniferum TaxID=3469 RepID=UPI000E6F624E|nr:la-related protein 6B-like [Papaver somniferum]RZC86817.1 hypothetical protein C5167_030163 [Papaver somniferum]
MAPKEVESVTETLEPSSSTSIDQSRTESVDSSSSVQSSSSTATASLNRNGSTGKKLLNAKAPEFVPRTNSSNGRSTDLLTQQPSRIVIQQIQTPIHLFPSPNFHHQFQNHGFGGGGGGGGGNSTGTGTGGGVGGGDHHDVVGNTQVQVQDPDPVPRTTNGLSEEISLKIVKQVEYYFSDANLATTDHLIKFISKDPEGFVPMSIVASFKKIKALVSGHAQLASVLKKSSKLVVSEDGKKVRRQTPFTESDMEELQSRIIIAENLPEDHSYQNLMKVFSAVGSVKTIRTCQPQPSNGGGGASAASKSGKGENMLYSNKLHAFVEYETVELAEKAVAELNDEKNWRSGVRVRILLKRKSKPTQGRKAVVEDKANGEEESIPISEQQPNEKQHPDDPCQSVSAATLNEQIGEECIDKEGGQPKKGRSRGRGKGRGRGQGQGQGQYHHNNHHNGHHNNHHNNHHSNHRNGHIGTPPSTNAFQKEHTTLVTKPPPGPRMPDGTKGFAMGRGKPLLTSTA